MKRFLLLLSVLYPVVAFSQIASREENMGSKSIDDNTYCFFKVNYFTNVLDNTKYALLTVGKSRHSITYETFTGDITPEEIPSLVATLKYAKDTLIPGNTDNKSVAFRAESGVTVLIEQNYKEEWEIKINPKGSSYESRMDFPVDDLDRILEIVEKCEKATQEFIKKK